MDRCLDKVGSIVCHCNLVLAKYDPVKIIICSAGSTWVLCKLVDAYTRCEDGVLVATKKKFFKVVRKLPWVEREIQKELGKSMSSLKKDVNEQNKGLTYNTHLPADGLTKEQIVKELQKLLGMGDFKAETGALSGVCHQPQEDRVDVVTTVYSMAAYTNPLNPDAYPGVRKMEAEVVRMTGSLFHGGPDMCGTMTSGGTESLILAVLAYRGFARETRGITRPNIVIPDSGHVALDKAGHLLGIAVRHVKVDPVTLTPTMKDMKKACDSNTVMLLASAPQYAHGIMDPVKEIAALGEAMNIPVHVDACLGGFLIAFADKVGVKLDPFDFRVPGVTSISADTHKFGYAPKGSSVIMYSSTKYIHHQYFVSADWTGGIFISPTLAGSRSGGVIAATWAALMNHGFNGYIEATRSLLNTANKVKEGVSRIPGLKLLGDPKLCIVAFSSDEFHIYRLADEMKDLGWMLSCLQYPTAVHLYIVPSHTKEGIIENFLRDLHIATDKVRNTPDELTGRAAVYGMAQQIPDKSLVSELAAGFMDILYSTTV